MENGENGTLKLKQQDFLQRKALLHRIEQRHATRTDRLQIGKLQLEFTRVANPGEVEVPAEQNAGSGTGAFEQPYWAESWDSAFVLAEWLTNRLIKDAAVLDLGCGMGLVGTVAAALGAVVTMVDAATPALLFSRYNTLAWSHRVSIQKVDWRRDQLDRSFQWILGSDVLYDQADWPFLHEFWSKQLAPCGTVVLVEPGRRTGDKFLQWIQTQPWQIEMQEVTGQAIVPTRIIQLRPLAPKANRS